MGTRDTTVEARRVQIAAFVALGPEGRVRAAAGLSEQLREVTRAGIRARHREYTEAQVNLAFLRILVGEAAFRQAFPDDDIAP